MTMSRSCLIGGHDHHRQDPAIRVVPMLSQFSVDATWFAEQARAAVRYAQRQAVAQRRTVYVDVSTAAIRVCYDSGCASPAPPLNPALGHQIAEIVRRLPEKR
jgi:ribosomal protein L11